MTIRKKIEIEEAMKEYDAGNWTVAIKILTKAKEEAEPVEQAEIDAYIGWNMWKMQRKEEAAEIWECMILTKAVLAGVASKATRASAHAGLGIYYAEKSDKEKALEHAQLAQDLLPEDATLQQNKNLNACGITVAKIGELGQAEEILKRVARINEQLEKSDDPEIAKEAKHQRAKNGYNLASLVYIPRRMYSAAIKELKNRVVSRYMEVGAETDLAAAYHRIAEAYENLRDYDNALHFEKMSLKLWEKHPDDPKRVETAKVNIARIEAKMREQE
jgi:tetratricopeptide (TPR) repeat protein